MAPADRMDQNHGPTTIVRAVDVLIPIDSELQYRHDQGNIIPPLMLHLLIECSSSRT